jgi:tetratricopeptide (TPR) repeat protein
MGALATVAALVWLAGRCRQDQLDRPQRGGSRTRGARGQCPSLDDVDTVALFADRQARLALLRGEGPRMLRAGNWRRAAELCQAWSNLEFWSPEPWRCLGYAMQAQGYHQDAINAFRKAAQYDPSDRSLDAAIDKSQKGIVLDFLNRYRR